jgi:hypothetical protein
MEGVFSFTIDPNRLRNDTLHCASWTNGRGDADFWIAFDSKDSIGRYAVGLNKAAEYDNYQAVQPNENITRIKIDMPYLIIYTSTYDSVRYIYYPHVPKGAAADYPLKQYTTRSLFRGEYSNLDSTRLFGSSRIYFDTLRIGHISGSPDYDSFDINTDVFSRTDSLDYMEFFDSRKQTESRSFTYKIKKNTLRLYENQDNPPVLLTKQQADTLLLP